MGFNLTIISGHISMGNQLLFTPFLRALKNEHPDATITTNSQILMDLVPELIDEFNGKAKQAIIIIPNYKVSLKTKIQGIHTIGFRYRIKGRFVRLFLDTPLHWDWSLHEVENNKQFLKIFHISERAYDLHLNPSFQLPKPGNVIGVHPGGRFDKRWPADKFAQICDKLIEMGHRVALFGGPEEMILTKEVRSHMKHDVYVDYSGMTTLPGVISLINICNFFFTNDSGLMHIASALRIPTVAIFGPTDFIKNRPYNKPYWIITKGLKCSPCYHFRRIICTNKHSFACLDTLSVEEVFTILKEKINQYIQI